MDNKVVNNSTLTTPSRYPSRKHVNDPVEKQWATGNDDNIGEQADDIGEIDWIRYTSRSNLRPRHVFLSFHGQFGSGQDSKSAKSPATNFPPR